MVALECPTSGGDSLRQLLQRAQLAWAVPSSLQACTTSCPRVVWRSSMTTAAEGHGLTVEVDDDMLVENAATATLFSPGMWVQRPTRTPLARREAALDIHCRWGNCSAHRFCDGANSAVLGGRGSFPAGCAVPPSLHACSTHPQHT